MQSKTICHEWVHAFCQKKEKNTATIQDFERNIMNGLVGRLIIAQLSMANRLDRRD